MKTFRNRILAAGAMLLAVRAIAADTNLETVTLKVNPSVFIKNIQARAAETMHAPGDHYSDILLDVLRMEGIDCSPPRDLVLDTKAGELTTQNTPEALAKLRLIVDDLNRADGERTYPPTNAPAKPEVLVSGQIYKMRSADFDGLNLGKPTARGGRMMSSWWTLSPQQLKAAREQIRAKGFDLLSAPRIQTSFGTAAMLFVGDETNSLELACLPIAYSGPQLIDLRVRAGTTGFFRAERAGDWPEFAGHTNTALFADAVAVEKGGLVFCARNDANVTNNLVVLLEVETVAKHQAMPHN